MHWLTRLCLILQPFSLAVSFYIFYYFKYSKGLFNEESLASFLAKFFLAGEEIGVEYQADGFALTDELAGVIILSLSSGVLFLCLLSGIRLFSARIDLKITPKLIVLSVALLILNIVLLFRLGLIYSI